MKINVIHVIIICYAKIHIAADMDRREYIGKENRGKNLSIMLGRVRAASALECGIWWKVSMAFGTDDSRDQGMIKLMKYTVLHLPLSV